MAAAEKATSNGAKGRGVGPLTALALIVVTTLAATWLFFGLARAMLPSPVESERSVAVGTTDGAEEDSSVVAQ